MRWRPAKLIGLATGVALVTLALYWPATRNGLTYWDDAGYLELADNHGLTWAGLKWAFTSTYIYYQPFTWISHGLDCVLWDGHYRGHHAHSVVLHALNALLVVMLAWQLSKWAAPWTETERLWFAGWVGLVFAVHPLQVEAVAWLAGRKTLLAATFSLAAVVAYVRWADDERRRGWWWVMVGAYVAALLSKPMAVTLPAILVALDLFPLHRVERHGWSTVLREKLPLLLPAAVVAALTFYGQAHAGALTAVSVGPGARVLVAARSLVFYIWKLAWPAWLSPFYPLGEGNDYCQAEFIVPAVLVVVMTGLALISCRRAPQLVAAWAAYMVLVLPVSGLFQAGGQAVADRFAYLPVVAILLLVGGGILWARQRLAALMRAGLMLALGVHLIWLVARTQEQIPVWHDDATMWQAVVEHVTASTTEYGYAARALVRQERFDEAFPYAERAYELSPNDPDSRRQVGVIYRDLASGLIHQRRFFDCLAVAQRAVELQPKDAVAHGALGLVFLKTGQHSQAVEQLEQALDLQADWPSTRYNLACAYARLGRYADATHALREAIAAAPEFAEWAQRDSELAGLRAQPEFDPRILRSTPN